MKNIFEVSTKEESLQRIKNLKADTKPLWGKMDAGQMLAHSNVAYKMAYEESVPKAKGIKKFLLKTFVKGMVVGEKAYPKNGRTSPDFLITDAKDFEAEKSKLIKNIEKTFEKGEAYFEGKENPSFGKMTAKEWSNLFQKHLDHHFNQFGI